MTRHYTLIELLVAMTIFLIIMLVLATMLSDTMKLSRRRKQQADLIRQQQVLGDIFATDLKNMVVNDDPVNENPVYFAPGSAAFVTTSTIGIDISQTTRCPLTCVRYAKDGSYLYRGVLQCTGTHNPFEWPITDSDVIAEGVEGFSIKATTYTGNPISGIGHKLPDLVTITLQFIDDADSKGSDNATRTFVKRIFINRGTD